MKPAYKGCIELINKQIKELLGIYRDAAKLLDISESEFWVWYTLIAMDGEYTQQDICNMWSLPKQTVNTAIAHMRRRKYAYLEKVPGRRTHKRIRLTEEGMHYGARVIEMVAQAEERALVRVTPEEFSRVTTVFGKYIDTFRSELPTV